VSAAAERPATLAAVRWLRTPEAVRERAAVVLAAAEADLTQHFEVDPSRLDAAAAIVVRMIRADYPDLEIPFHSRWRHFEVGQRDRWRALGRRLAIAIMIMSPPRSTPGTA
jgi:hypothetical protein